MTAPISGDSSLLFLGKVQHAPSFFLLARGEEYSQSQDSPTHLIQTGPILTSNLNVKLPIKLIIVITTAIN